MWMRPYEYADFQGDPFMLAPLENIRVLDLTRLLPGGICTLMLADQGAEVIKIEQPHLGDYARWYIPRVGEYAAVFHAMNRNKSSLVLDLKKAEGVGLLKRLVETADVLVESFRPNVIKRLGISYDDLKAINPRLVVCSLSGYGQTGDFANTAGHDLNFAAVSGVLAAGNEQVLPVLAMDFGGAYFGAFAISTALFQRERTGKGTHIDVALLDSGISMMTLARAESFARQRPPLPNGETLSGGFACYRVYRTADNLPLVLAALEPKFWESFCRLAGRDDLAIVNFLSPDEQPTLIETMTQLIASKSHAEWMRLLDGSETCATGILDVMQAAEHPALQARGALYMADGVAHTRSPFHIGDPIPHRPAPKLGADTERVLSEIGLSEAELAKLRQDGVTN
jgi:alpha-methylacyl-CoA racemase